MRQLGVILGLLVACEAPSGPDVADGADPDGPTVGVRGAVDGVVAGGGDSTTDQRLPTPIGELPGDWGAGFVRVDEDPTHVLVVDPGDFATQRGAQSTVAFWSDLDVDGIPEVVTGTRRDAGVATWVGRVQRWTPDGLVDDALLTAALNEGDRTYGGPNSPVAALDLDGDGWKDLLGEGLDSAVRWGTGPGTFGPWVSLLPEGVHEGGGAVGVLDLDADGWLDLIFGGRLHGDDPFQIALRTGPRTFDPGPGEFRDGGILTRSFLTFLTRDGTWVVYAIADAPTGGDATPYPFYRLDRLDAALRPTLQVFDPLIAEPWWSFAPEYAGFGIARMAPMGAGVDDLDGDGFVDMVVSLGSSIQGIFAGRSNGMFEALSTFRMPQGIERPLLPWSVAFPDLDDDGRGDVIWTVGDDETSFVLVRGNPMVPLVSWNDGAFALPVVDVGLDPEGSWEALGLADPDADGDADVVIGGHGSAPVVYRNDIDVDGRKGVTLRLVGTTSDPLAIGARLSVEVDGLPPRTTTVGNLGNRNGQSEPLTFVGAGHADTIDRVHVRWPSGYEQDVVDVPVGGMVTLVEPPTVEVLDADRHAAANGADCIDVRVTPRDVSGAPVPAGSVTIQPLGVTADVSAPREHAGVWTATACSGTPGVTALKVTIDRHEVRARPKLFWDVVE